MLRQLPRGATALGAMLVGVAVMALAVSTPGFSADPAVAPAVFRVELHTVGTAVAVIAPGVVRHPHPAAD